MKKRVLRLLFGFGYVGLVTGVFFAQFQSLQGTAGGKIALLELFLLGVPLIIVLILYIRLADTAGQRKEQGLAEGKGAEQVSEEKPVGYEEIYAHFLGKTQSCHLSERELEIAWLLYRGYTNRQIGEELFIAETTVKKHVSHIYEKMELTGRKAFRAKIDEK